MYVERHTVNLTTDSSGNATGYTPNVTGRVVSIQYVKTDFADGIDFVVSGDATGLAIWTKTDVNASVTVYPVHPAVTAAAGAASTLSEPPICVVNERIKVVVAQGGSVKTGKVHILIA